MYVFSQVAAAGSISKGAECLGLSKSVVSQHLKALEEELGVVLIKRTTRLQHLTSVGEQFYLKCQKMNQICEGAWDEVRQNQDVPRGRLRITSSHALMSSLVAPAAGHLLKEYVELNIELITNDHHLDLMSEDVDLAIRVGGSGDSNLRQRRIGHFRDVLCINQSANISAPEQVPYIANHWQGRQVQHHFCHRHTQETQVLAFQPRCTADSFNTCLGLIHQGDGMGIIPEFIYHRQEGLKEVLPEYQLPVVDVYALHPFQGKPPVGISMCLRLIEQHLDSGTLF